MNFKEEIAKILLSEIDILDYNEILSLIEIPPNDNWGNYAFPCFKLSKQLKKTPHNISSEIAKSVTKPNWIHDIRAVGPYINFFVDKTLFAKEIITKILNYKDDYGKSNIGMGHNVVIDYSSPNIAKPFHVGHLRSTVIGNALYNVFNYIGYVSVGINHLGDWGTQFGKLIVAYKLWGDDKAIEEKGLQELTRIYVKFHDMAEKDNSLNDEARSWLVKMQDGDIEALSLWKKFYDISIKEFNRIYEMLEIKFDSWCGESFYTDKMPAVVQELKDKSLLTQSEGAMIVDLEKYNMPPCLILRKDGGTLYPTRDIAAAIFRKQEYNFSKCIILTALDQNLHFAQWFKIIELMGREWAEQLVHVPFGLVRFEDGKLSTRKGNVVLMEDLLNLAIQKTKDIIQIKNPTLKNKEETAQAVGIGAIIFNDLYNQRIKDVTFSFEKMLSFEGETGPYVQYTHARSCSILSKLESTAIDTNNINYSLLDDDASFLVIKTLSKFPDKIIEAANKYEPYIISRYLIELCKAFNKFYNENNILLCKEDLKIARLSIVICVQNVLKNGLSILGIKAVQSM